ncbi:TIGR00180 family glycosyltransferase, partial [bacterium]|nr:TIGR00180 family glycosyltransferase [bacterium]
MVSPKSSLLNKHTLHIPIRNRPKWLEYTLSLYKMYNYSGVILVADDSDQLIYEQNVKIINIFKDDLKINHFRSKNNFFNEQNRRFNYTKYFSYKEIDTEYYSCTSDDDLFYVDFAYDAINYLDRNQDYSAVTGADMKIYFDKEFKIKNTFIKWWPDSHYEDALDRLMDYTQNPSAAYLGVCRTSSLKDIFDLEKEKNSFCFIRDDKDLGLSDFDMEIPWMMQLYISGKIGRINNKLNSFRGEHNSEDRHTFNLLQKNIGNNKSKIYGSIIPVLNNTFSASIKKTYEDLYYLLMKKTKYEHNVVEDVL